MNRAVFPLLLITFLTACPSRGVAADVHFGRDVRPILAKNCFLCHGADESSREADLRLDLREKALPVLSPAGHQCKGPRAGAILPQSLPTRSQ